MAQKNAVVVYEHDVYVLSQQGEVELRESETSLSPTDIELLVRTDGKLTVADIAESMRLLAREAAIHAYGKLINRKLVTLHSGEKSDLHGMADLFSGKPPPPTRKAVTAAKAEASAGVSSLQKQGYYVRIARRNAARPPTAPGKALFAVVVEDEPHLAKFLKQYLSFEGFDACIAGNRNEIVAALRRASPPDLVLLDVTLPDADGFDILLKIRQHPVLKSVPVIMLTAKATREAVLQGLAGGADGYITKPFEVDALIKAVGTVLGLPKSPSAGKSKL